jgi:hypothetical protein
LNREQRKAKADQKKTDVAGIKRKANWQFIHRLVERERIEIRKEISLSTDY